MRLSYLHLAFSVVSVSYLILPLHLVGQMYNNKTVYTDFDNSYSPTLHVWGYTYAPSGSSINHTYQVSTTVTLPNGSSSYQTGNGSSDSAAQTDLWIDTSSVTVDGVIVVSSSNKAWCPYYGSNPFLSITTYPHFDLGIKYTTSHWTGGAASPGPGQNTIYCPVANACTNTSTRHARFQGLRSLRHQLARAIIDRCFSPKGPSELRHGIARQA